MNALVDLLDSPDTRWAFAIAVAGLVALGAFQLRALDASGLIAATIIGSAIVATAGWWPGVILVAFFVTASALSHFSSGQNPHGHQARGKRRDAVQVFANGGLPAALAVLSVIASNQGPWLVAMVAAVAGATSDTWGTETGRLSRATPYVITSGKRASPGTSGAVSTWGSLGSFCGALLIGVVAACGYAVGWQVPDLSAGQLIFVVTIAGFLGSLLDSVLGATAQASYRCPQCQATTEQLVHHCGTPTILQRGLRWLNNDTVNFLSIAGAALAGLALASIWP